MAGVDDRQEERAGAAGRSFQEMLALYPKLRWLAGSFMRRERSDHTLQPTALVHEVYLRLCRQGEFAGGNNGVSLGIAARAMRAVLVEHARKRRARKRGGAFVRRPLVETLVSGRDGTLDLLALEEALQRLQELDPELARIVELRFFIGLDSAAIAEVLGVSTRTVERGWRAARTWLHHALSEAT